MPRPCEKKLGVGLGHPRGYWINIQYPLDDLGFGFESIVYKYLYEWFNMLKAMRNWEYSLTGLKYCD